MEEDIMKNRKSVAAGAWIAVAALLSHALVGCRDAGVSADDRSSDSKSFLSQLASPFTRETGTVPVGTQIRIRLKQGISTEKNSSGEPFYASLDEPLTADGKALAPAGSEVVGELTNVEESGRVEGRARLTMTLREVVVNGEEYDLEVNPLTLVARSTKKKDAGTIAGSAAVGAVIGAIAGGGKGAAIGAASGGGAGTGYVLATKGEAVEYGPESRFAFSLSSPLQLPVVEDDN
jgi:hypothetical protein